MDEPRVGLLVAVSVHILLLDSYEDVEGICVSFEVVSKIGKIAGMTNDGTQLKIVSTECNTGWTLLETPE